MILALISGVALPSAEAAERRPFLTKVEHFFLTSAESERLFRFFRDEIRLPVVWPFKSYGEFASGGLSLGNVAMEFVTEKGAGARAEFEGIAFEPSGGAEAAIAELERRQIPHGKPEPFKSTQDGEERVGWITIDLEGFPPAGAYLFLCDYQQRERVAEGRDRARQELVAEGGGPLGVTSLREIVLGVKSVEEASREWSKLVDAPTPGEAAVFALESGPKIRLVRADAEGIQNIVIGVKSAERARQFLAERRMLEEVSNGQLSIDPAAVGGLGIALVQD